MEKNFNVWLIRPEKKIRTRTPIGDESSYNVCLAKNATEPFQVVFLAKESDQKGISIEVENDHQDQFEVEVLREHYVSCEGMLWPDPVVPNEYDFDLKKGVNLTYLINVSTKTETVAGNYTAKIIVRQNGEIFGEYPIYVTVWNFALDDTKYMETAFGTQISRIKAHQKSDDYEALYKKYYDTLLDRYHICAYDLPYDILDPRADAYMSDPRVKSFKIPYWGGETDKVVKYYEKLKTNPEWLKKAYFYVVDEPQVMADYDRIKDAYEKLQKVYPNAPMVSPFYMDPRDGNGVRAVELLQKYCSVWSPKISLFKDDWYTEFMRKRNEAGDRIWWYYCWEPPLPYANVFIDMECFYHRVLTWQQYLHGINGMLYWSTTYWEYGNPWEETSTVPYLSPYCFGDGSLFYPGDRIGIDGPVGSLRLEILRSAIEDYQMFQLAAEAFGREYVDEKIASITPKVYIYDDVQWHMNIIRKEIGDKLSEYYSNK
ncbi:MAG: DUF4091 domain-containing protein [Clostridia bacterium]|nr:DUF4091 domain-containing protein [Clostridia bacterium]